MSITGLSNQYISQSFQGLLQVSSSGQLYDGDGNLVTLLNVSTSYALNGGSGGGSGNYATTGSNTFFGSQTVSGSITVTGNITATQYIVSSSVINVIETNLSGSHIFGNSQDDTHQFTGSIYITGSIQNVAYIDFNTGSATPAWKSGRIFWDNTEQSLSVYNSEADITLQVGQEEWVRVWNDTGALIANGTAVRLEGSHGDAPKVKLAQSLLVSGSVNIVNQIIGVATHDIETNSFGYITTRGLIHGLYTNNFPEGDILFVSSSAGKITNIAPSPPYEIIPIGTCVKQGPGQSGIIYVTVAQPIDFADLSSAEVGTYHYGDLWTYKQSGAYGTWQHTNQLSGSYGVTGSINATSFTGSLSGTATNASKIAIATSAVNSVLYPTFVDATTGNLSMYVDTELTYNPFANSLSATSVTSSLFGTSSWAQNVISSSYALTASYALNGGGGSSTPAFPFTGSAQISGSLIVTGSVSATRGGFTGSLQGSASFATTASFATYAATASIGPGTVNYITKFTTSTKIGNSIIYETGGKVGINTAGPTEVLDVSGEAVVSGVHIGRSNGGNYNTRLGNDAMKMNTLGNENIAIGYNSMYNLDSGLRNTAIGYRTLFNCINNIDNVAVGYQAGYNINTSYNVYIGASAGYYHQTGSSVIIIGNGAGGLASSINSNSVIINSNYTPGSDLFDYVTGSFIAISGAGHRFPNIWYNELLDVPRETTTLVLSIDPSTLSAAFIEYSLTDSTYLNNRAGYIKLITDQYGTFEYVEDVATCLGDTYQYTFDITYDAGKSLILVSVDNASGRDIVFSLSCRFNAQAKF